MRGCKNRVLSRVAAVGVMLTTALLSGVALAAPNGQPQPAQMNLPSPATETMREIVWFHNWLIVLITAISLFVLVLLVYACWRFSAKRNPVPSKLTHHTGLEVAWTIIPVLILVVIAIPSFRILRDQLVIPPADITVKITGKQWYWTWEYAKDNGGFSFDQLMMDDQQRVQAINGGQLRADEAPRLLAVDNEALIPVGKVVRVQVTAADVIHQFAIPAFGQKLLAVPGRLNETWFKVDQEGIFYGQCQFVCGQNHAYMPLAIRVVSQARYDEWIAESQKKFASRDGAATRVAAAAAQ